MRTQTKDQMFPAYVYETNSYRKNLSKVKPKWNNQSSKIIPNSFFLEEIVCSSSRIYGKFKLSNGTTSNITLKPKTVIDYYESKGKLTSNENEFILGYKNEMFFKNGKLYQNKVDHSGNVPKKELVVGNVYYCIYTEYRKNKPPVLKTTQQLYLGTVKKKSQYRKYDPTPIWCSVNNQQQEFSVFQQPKFVVMTAAMPEASFLEAMKEQAVKQLEIDIYQP